uniref:Kallikrein-related peptidase 2 n=1 Tax=Canis lupus familiaris TaxID=9615 RepID=A0A8P0N5X1_CANLF
MPADRGFSLGPTPLRALCPYDVFFICAFLQPLKTSLSLNFLALPSVGLYKCCCFAPGLSPCPWPFPVYYGILGEHIGGKGSEARKSPEVRSGDRDQEDGHLEPAIQGHQAVTDHQVDVGTRNCEVWLGRHNLSESEDEGQLVQVRKSFIHPLYKTKVPRAVIRPGEDRSHDLMLLHLEEPAKITKAVRVMDLPKKEPPLGSTCYVSGWGSTDPETIFHPGSLQCVDLKLLSNNQCAKVYTQKVTKFMLCAGVLEGKKDTCKGDSGGPLICDGELVGITSWGATPCGKPQMPSLYTRVMPHLMWIKDTMKANT